MLSRRYVDDGKPLLSLNKLQLQIKRQIEEKVRNRTYRFEATACCVCQGSNFELLAQKDRYGLRMPVVICRDCGLIQTNPRMSQEAYDQFYRDEYRQLYQGTETPTDDFFQEQYRQGRRIFTFLANHGLLPNPVDTLVLEVGCGAGGILKHFQENGCRVKGIDLGESYLDYGRIRHGLDLVAGTIHDIQFDRQPDLVIYSHVLEHIPQPNRELQKVYQVLAKKGLLYVEIPSAKHLHDWYDMDFLRFLQNAHVYHFTLTTLCSLLGRNGFELLFGTEKVDSVFRKNASGLLCRDSEMENDYWSAMRYLERAERLHPWFRIRRGILSPVRNCATSVLKALGLFRYARNLRRRLRGAN